MCFVTTIAGEGETFSLFFPVFSSPVPDGFSERVFTAHVFLTSKIQNRNKQIAVCKIKWYSRNTHFRLSITLCPPSIPVYVWPTLPAPRRFSSIQVNWRTHMPRRSMTKIFLCRVSSPPFLVGHRLRFRHGFPIIHYNNNNISSVVFDENRYPSTTTTCSILLTTPAAKRKKKPI